MKIEQCDIEAFAADLIELDSVYRKLSMNARVIFTKIVCLYCMRENIETANAIVNGAGTPMNTVELLAEHFAPFADEHVSL